MDPIEIAKGIGIPGLLFVMWWYESQRAAAAEKQKDAAYRDYRDACEKQAGTISQLEAIIKITEQHAAAETRMAESIDRLSSMIHELAEGRGIK